MCGKVLSDKYKLQYHLKVHSDKKNFKCGTCSAQFKARENLQKHLVKFHSDKSGQIAKPTNVENDATGRVTR